MEAFRRMMRNIAPIIPMTVILTLGGYLEGQPTECYVMDVGKRGEPLYVWVSDHTPDGLCHS